MCGDAGTSEKIRRHAASKAILWDVVIRTELTKIENLTSLRPSGEYLLGRLVERGSQYLVSFLLHGQMRYVYVPNLLQLLRVLRRRAWLAGPSNLDNTIAFYRVGNGTATLSSISMHRFELPHSNPAKLCCLGDTMGRARLPLPVGLRFCLLVVDKTPD